MLPATAGSYRGCLPCSLEHLVFQLTHQKSPSDCRDIADQTVSKFQKVISIFNRTGHARFHRGSSATATPVTGRTLNLALAPPQVRQHQSLPLPPLPAASHALTLDFTKPDPTPCHEIAAVQYSKESFSISAPLSSASSSFLSSIAGDGSVSNGKQGSSQLPLVAPAASTGKPPLLSSMSHLSALKAELVDLINRDYADFVSLSTRLVDVDSAVARMRDPLVEFRDKVAAFRAIVDSSLSNLRTGLFLRVRPQGPPPDALLPGSRHQLGRRHTAAHSTDFSPSATVKTTAQLSKQFHFSPSLVLRLLCIHAARLGIARVKSHPNSTESSFSHLRGMMGTSACTNLRAAWILECQINKFEKIN